MQGEGCALLENPKQEVLGILRFRGYNFRLSGGEENAKYKAIFVGCKAEWIPEGYTGCALTCAPYVVLARDAVPAGEKPDALLNLTISEWEKAIGLSPLKCNSDKP